MQKWQLISACLSSSIISVKVSLPNDIKTFLILSFEQLQSNLTSHISNIFGSNPSNTTFNISSGVIPSLNIVVTDFNLATFCSKVAIVSSVASGINWTINPPACSTVVSVVRTPNDTTDGVCSDNAK